MPRAGRSLGPPTLLTLLTLLTLPFVFVVSSTAQGWENLDASMQRCVEAWWTQGEWVDDVYTPSTGTCGDTSFARMDVKSLHDLLQSRGMTWIHFVGDSHARLLYNRTVVALGGQAHQLQHHEDGLVVIESPHHVALTFHWSPLATDIVQYQIPGNDSRPDLVVLSLMGWDVLHLQDEKAFEGNLTRGMRSLRSQRTVCMSNPSVVTDHMTNETKQIRMTDEAMRHYGEILHSVAQMFGSPYIDFRAFTLNVSHRSLDGVHFDSGVYDEAVQLLFNGIRALVPRAAYNEKSVIALPNTTTNATQPLKLPPVSTHPALALGVIACVVAMVLLHDPFLFANVFTWLVGGADFTTYEDGFARLHAKLGVEVQEASNDVNT